MLKRVTAVLAIMFGLIIGGLASAAPAQAAASDCLQTYICLFDGNNYTGTVYQWTPSYIYGRPGHCLNLTASQNNTTSSVISNNGAPGLLVTFWLGAGCVHGTSSFGLAGTGRVVNLASTLGAGFNNSFSSVSQDRCC